MTRNRKPLLVAAAVLWFCIAADSPTTMPATAPSDLLKDPSFAQLNAPGSWQVSTMDGGSVSIAKDTTDAAHPALAMTVDKVDSTDWHAQVYQSGLSVTKDAKYLLNFTAKASATRNMAVFIQQLSAPYTMLTDGHAVALTTDATQNKVEFTAKDTSTDAKLTFVVGQSTGTITITDLSLTKEE